MDQTELTKKIDAYLEKNWDAMVDDIATLVRIPSFQEDDKKADGAPFGPGPKKALAAALELAGGMGFTTHDAEGYIGFADFPGASDTQLGIIGHMDVVPAGPGWTFEPYEVTRKDGYLIGRGTLDDKGPSVMALHAMKFWKELQDQGEAPQFPYTVRFLFGANEESGMADVAYYHLHYDDPAFLFTPDAEFPVCYGEKGGYDGMLMSKPIEPCARVIVEFEGGAATNAVPGLAHAIVNADAHELKSTDRIVVTEAGPGRARLEATGKGAHASLPDDGINAIGLIVDYLLENGLCGADERAFLELDQKLLNHTDGSGVGIKSSDEYFGPLTVIGGTIALKDDRFVQTVDSRFPTSITADEITERLRQLAEEIGGSFESTLLMEPFLVKPDSPVIQALLNAYNEATGEDAKPFTMGGGTYAREFKSGASFGPEKPWEKNPDWVGTMHGPDEGVSEDLLRQSFKIYALTLDKLMQLDLK